MKQRIWRAVRWAAVAIGVSVFACGAVNRLTTGRSPPVELDAGSFDEVAEAALPARPVDASVSPDSAEPVRLPPCPARKRRRLVGTLNLNTATIDELIRLPGIGDAKARRIVARRSRRGPFRAVRELRRVRGFGRKSVEKLAPYLTITGPTTLRRE